METYGVVQNSSIMFSHYSNPFFGLNNDKQHCHIPHTEHTVQWKGRKLLMWAFFKKLCVIASM